jgi:DNA-binding NarL/FixJ family response regulator
MSIKVLIAEDYPSMRHALRRFLEANADMEIVGEAVDGQEAVRQCLRSKPEVVTMDIRMPGVDGVQATWQISRLMPQVAVLAVSGEAELWCVQEMFAAGASGYILKDFLYEDLEAAIRTLVCRGAFLGHLVIDKVLAHGINDKNPWAQREMAVLRCLAQGRSREQIALDLHLTPDTVRQTLRSIGQNASTSAIRRLVSPTETE